MTTATSLLLVAIGAILAFAVFTVVGINIQAVGAILIIVGGIGLAVAIATIGGYAPWGGGRDRTGSPPTSIPPVP